MALTIRWTEGALIDLKSTSEYLEAFWTERELKNFSKGLEQTLSIIIHHPLIFPVSVQKKHIHRAIVDANNVLYYRISRDEIEVLALFNPSQHPNRIVKTLK